jgi:hypothetical protein
MLRKEEVLQEIGEVNDCLYFIEKGLLGFYMLLEKGKQTVAFRREDQFIFTLNYFSSVHTPCMGIEALEDCKLWRIPWSMVEELRKEHMRFMFQLEQIMIRDIVTIQNHWPCTRRNGGLSNLLSFCRIFPQLIHRVPLEHIASLTQIPEKKVKNLLKSYEKSKPLGRTLLR